MALANAFNVRTDSLNVLQNIQQNKAFLQVMVLIVVVQIGMTYLGGGLLRTAPLQLQEWLVLVLCAGVAWAAGIVVKLLEGI